MTAEPSAFLDAARSFLGVPYRLHGRTRNGVDCLGLVLASVHAAGGPLLKAGGYALRNIDTQRFLPLSAQAGFLPCSWTGEEKADGDVWLLRTGPALNHCAILDGDSLIHAHAGLRRVVRQPIPNDWQLLAAFRMKGVR